MFSKESADMFFKATYEHESRSSGYEPFEGLPRPAKPKHSFDCSIPTLDEFDDVCAKKSNGSAAGLNGNQYLVYKRCPEVRRFLFQIIKRVWKERKIPREWTVGRIRLLPKSENTNEPGLMRPITVLNVEGRIFWSIYQRRMASYMLINGYIDHRVQKAFLEGVAGCIEHGTFHAEMLEDAKQAQRALCVYGWT